MILPGHYGFKKEREHGVLRSTCPNEVAQVCALAIVVLASRMSSGCSRVRS